MEFVDLVKTQLFPILKKYDFEISEEITDSIVFQSWELEIGTFYNPYDRTSSISIGKKGEEQLPLYDSVVQEIFNSSLPVEQVTPETFVHNLSLVFQTKEGESLLKGNSEPFTKATEAKIHNDFAGFMQKQTLAAAAKAWEAQDYGTFIAIMEKLDRNQLPESWLLKYSIAKKKS